MGWGLRGPTKPGASLSNLGKPGPAPPAGCEMRDAGSPRFFVARRDLDPSVVPEDWIGLNRIGLGWTGRGQRAEGRRQ